MTVAATPVAKFTALRVLAMLLVIFGGETHADFHHDLPSQLTLKDLDRPGAWKYLEKVDEMTDVKSVATQWDEVGKDIVIQCDDVNAAKKVSVFVVVSRKFFAGIWGTDIDVMWRFDSQPAVAERGVVVPASQSDMGAIRISGSIAESFARRLAAARKLLFRIYDFEGSPLTFEFDDLKGGDTHIRKVLDACH